MIYSHVVENEWDKILPSKAKYTKRDVERVIEWSRSKGPKVFTGSEARFIVVCTAIRHNAQVSHYCEYYCSLERLRRLVKRSRLC